MLMEREPTSSLPLPPQPSIPNSEALPQATLAVAEQQQEVGPHALLAAETLQKQIDTIRRQKRDPLDKREYMDATAPMWVLGSLCCSLTEMLQYGGKASPALIIGGIGTGVVGLARICQTRKNGSVTMPEGYGLQPLYARKSFEAVSEGEVMVAVCPRQYNKGEAESASIAKTRLQEALEVALLAGADKVLVPDTILDTVNVGLRGTAGYRRLLANTTAHGSKVPEGQKDCMVLSRVAAAALAERLDMRDLPWERVLNALQQRFPQEARLTTLAGAPEKLLPVLHGLTQRALDGELLGAKMERMPGTLGAQLKRRVPLATRLDAGGDPYDPLVQQHAVGRYEPDEQQCLSRLVAKGLPAERLTDGLLERLQSSECSDLQLLYLGLQSIKQQDQVQVTNPDEPQRNPGAEPLFVRLAGTEYYLPHMKRFLAKFAIATALVTAVQPYASDAVDTVRHWISASQPGIDMTTGYSPTLGDTTPEWHLEDHGMKSNGYWAQEVSYTYDVAAKRWLPANAPLTDRHVPTAIAPSTSHITVSRTITKGNYWLPMPDGGDVGALRAQDEQHHNVPYALEQTESGTYEVILKSAGNIDLSYDVVVGEHPTLQAKNNVQIKGGLDPQALREPLRASQQDLDSTARYMRGKYQYDNTTALDKLVAQPSAADLANAVDKAARCNCNVCATALAISSVAQDPERKLAYTTGYMHDKAGGSLTKGTAHAWLTDQWGRVVDATPGTGTDPTGITGQQHKSPEKTPDNPFPASLLGAMLLAAAALEFRYKPARKLAGKAYGSLQKRTAARHLTPEQSYQLLSWAAYGDPKNPPRVTASTMQPKWDNIPARTLANVARQGLANAPLAKREQKSLQRTAKFLLRGRNGAR